VEFAMTAELADTDSYGQFRERKYGAGLPFVVVRLFYGLD